MAAAECQIGKAGGVCACKKIVIVDLVLIVPGNVNAIPLAVVHFYIIPGVRFAVTVVVDAVSRNINAGDIVLVTQNLERLCIACANGKIFIACTVLIYPVKRAVCGLIISCIIAVRESTSNGGIVIVNGIAKVVMDSL